MPRRASLVTLLLALPLLAAATRVTGEPTAGFRGRGPGGFSLDGKTRQLRVEDDGKVLKIVVPLAGVQTGISLRDRHMRERYLEVDKYPDAVLEVPWSAVKLPEDGQTSEGTAPGKMSLHGKSHDVQVKYRIVRTGNRYQVTGNVPLNITDYGIEVPSYLGITVQPDVEASASFTAERLSLDGRRASDALGHPLVRGSRSARGRATAGRSSARAAARARAARGPGPRLPWMIRHGYTNCSACHVDPSGFGLLTEYGRGQAQIVLPRSGEGPRGSRADDRHRLRRRAPAELAERGPLAPGRRPQHHRLGETKWRDILMVADLRAGVTAGPFRPRRASATCPPARPGRADQPAADNIVSREHWLGVRLADQKLYLLGGG
jgi:polyisoprenoid-binding protein YceI